MNFPPLLPLRVRKSQVCDRCGLWYPKEASQCPHCHGLDDAGVEQLRERSTEEHAGNANLGNLFLWIAIALPLVVLVIAFIAI
jgi:ribosomal protein L40E